MRNSHWIKRQIYEHADLIVRLQSRADLLEELGVMELANSVRDDVKKRKFELKTHYADYKS